MAHRLLNRFALIAILALSGCAQPGQTDRNLALPRNAIFILSDDHRYDFMGFLDTPEFLETPGLDKIAASGVHIENAFVTTALCSPSRASILTGQYAHRHGVVDNQRLVPEGTVFFPELLQKAGYKTAFMGKWHMGSDDDNPRPGFDRWVSFRGQGTYYDPILNIDGERTEFEGYTADILTEYALEWLEEVKDQKFFLFLSHKSVHGMFEPAQRHLDQYADVELTYAETMEDTEENYLNRPDWVREQRNSWHGVDFMYHGEMDFDTFYRRYCETLLGLDESVVHVMDYLETSRLEEETLLMYMGDNGFSFGEHGLIDKRHMYEESMRVPFLAQAPGFIEPGTKLSGLIQNIDIGPTVLDLAGVPVPENMDGRSFLPLLAGEEIPWRDNVLYEYYWEWNYPQTPTTLGIRGDRYKYIFYHGIWDKDELYDLQEDPLENNNLAADSAYLDIVLEMRDQLFNQLESTGGMWVPLREPKGFRGDLRREDCVGIDCRQGSQSTR
jgi:N-acetylglucosamine-6-sulfatase